MMILKYNRVKKKIGHVLIYDNMSKYLKVHYSLF